MTFPALITVGWHQYSDGASDAYGEVTPVYTPPLNQPGTTVYVIGIAPRSTAHVPISGHDRIVTDKTMYANVGCPIGTYDYVDLPEGAQYLVEGIGEDWSQGPFSPMVAGVEYQLRRITG
jgi:hypothetical protein